MVPSSKLSNSNDVLIYWYLYFRADFWAYAGIYAVNKVS